MLPAVPSARRLEPVSGAVSVSSVSGTHKTDGTPELRLRFLRLSVSSLQATPTRFTLVDGRENQGPSEMLARLVSATRSQVEPRDNEERVRRGLSRAHDLRP